jgi:hypothetical protein
MKPYKLQSVQAWKPEDLAVRYEFCRDFLARIENNGYFSGRFIFSEEATFRMKGSVFVSGEHRIFMAPSSTEEIHQKLMCFVPLRRSRFMAPSFS